MLPTRRSTASLAIAAILITLPARAATLHVPADYPTIQACIEAAVSGADECVVAPNTYNETIDFLGKAITLRSSGGAEVTTIDAQGAGTVVTCVSSEGPNTILDGFTVTGGLATNGGGMSNISSSPTVRNCTFSANTAARTGGGMLNKFFSSPTVSNCTFSGNTADRGGGIYNAADSNATVSNCTFVGNKATGNGGGINSFTSSPTVSNCTFHENEAMDDGGGMYNNSGFPIVTDCTFSGNTAGFSGGGMNNAVTKIIVSNCDFYNNHAMGGGGMGSQGSYTTVINCAFGGNTALLGGGGIGGATNMTVINSAFSGNSAEFWGGAIHAPGSSALTNCTFSRNTAPSGGAIYIFRDTTVTNCVLWGNSPAQVFVQPSSQLPLVSFSDIQGGLPGGAIDGGGNVNLDPMFLDADGADNVIGTEDDDLRMQSGSLCINAGDTGALPADVADLDDDGDIVEPTPLDLDGHARVLCEVVDMGAYEWGIGDGECDEDVDLDDYASYINCVTGPGGEELPESCEPFDFDGDGDSDLHDFGGFQVTFSGNP